MSETIYIKETREFLTSTGYVVKESELSKEELKELKKDCSSVSRLFGNTEADSPILKG